jgi:predicted SPOUT superfamily RNA methylase MTH1
LEGAFKADPEISAKDPAKYFKYYLNSLPNQGSRVIRTEEAIPITLTAVKCKLNEMIT